MAESIIIGIHGLNNKPPKPILEKWWRAAISEGLGHNVAFVEPVPFALAYWADLRYSSPVDPDLDDEPYQELAVSTDEVRRSRNLFDKPRAIFQDHAGRLVDFAKDRVDLDVLVEALWGYKCADLSAYCSVSTDESRRQIRSRLETVLRLHADKRILLIAHSMGAIVAYDALRNQEPSGVAVDHLLTIGAPLGLPSVSAKMREWFVKLRTPQNVRRWTNIADRSDRVALDAGLQDEYGPFENVSVKDAFVRNDYVGKNGPNHHKAYGYLRTPEVSAIIRDFAGASTL